MNHLGYYNPNADIFEIQTLEGSAKDDLGHGSIGAATMSHVQQLSQAERQLWEEMIHMKSGAIFRAVPSFEQFDKDPFNLKGKDLEEITSKFKSAGVSDQMLGAVKEAIEEETNRRLASSDAMDRGELIGFDEWEDYPQMWSTIEIPTSPKDKMIYLGTCSQPFYDFFPEGHRDADFINRILIACDKDWSSEESQGYGQWLIKQVIKNSDTRQYVQSALIQMVESFLNTDKNPDEIVIYCLQKIDSEWSSRYRSFIKKQFLKDEMVQTLEYNIREWDKQFKEGRSVIDSIKRFGSSIYRNKDLKRKMTRSTWALYSKAKTRFTEPIIFKGTDLNRCSIQDLQKTLNIDEMQARNIWWERPFESLLAMKQEGYIDKRIFTENPLVAQFIENIEQATKQSKTVRNLRPLIELRKQLNQLQTHQNEFSAEQWNLIWNYYRISRADTTRAIKNGEKKETNG